MSKDTDEKFSDEEARRRLEAALRSARMVGHKPQAEMKLGKSKSGSRKKTARPKRRS